ncbi:hypothetical protein WN55_09831 [Dufourea novaeangliae]|nr:hypothetical protein WN55_09831 [Dufourea novaeangliae]
MKKLEDMSTIWNNPYPPKKRKERTQAISEAMTFMKSLYIKISRAYVDLAARYQEVFTLKEQLVSAINPNIADNLSDEIISIKQQLQKSFNHEIQKILNVNIAQHKALEENVIKNVTDSVSNAMLSLESTVATKTLPTSRSYVSALRTDNIPVPPSISISKSHTITVNRIKEFVVWL